MVLNQSKLGSLPEKFQNCEELPLPLPMIKAKFVDSPNINHYKVRQVSEDPKLLILQGRNGIIDNPETIN